MIIDYSMYAEFLRNPEKCRLTYIKNLVPKKTPDYFVLGGMFAKALELHYKHKFSNAEIRKALAKDPEYSKRKDFAQQLEKAMRLFEAFRMHRANSDYKKIGAEEEFLYPLEEHFVCGRMDEILESGRKVFLGEIKHQNAKKKATTPEFRWKHDAQAGFIALGYWRYIAKKPLADTNLIITTVTDSNPPRPVETKAFRSKEYLEIFEQHVLAVARMIQSFRDFFGDDKPWPHTINAYPCSMDRCEYGQICNQAKLDAVLVKRDFKTREEHLEILRDKKLLRTGSEQKKLEKKVTKMTGRPSIEEILEDLIYHGRGKFSQKRDAIVIAKSKSAIEEIFGK